MNAIAITLLLASCIILPGLGFLYRVFKAG